MNAHMKQLLVTTVGIWLMANALAPYSAAAGTVPLTNRLQRGPHPPESQIQLSHSRTGGHPAIARGDDAGVSPLSDQHRQFLAKSIIARWYVTDKGTLPLALARGIDVLEDVPTAKDGFFTVLLTQTTLDSLRRAGHSLDVLNHNWYESFTPATSSPNGGFRTLAQALALLDSIHTEHSGISTARYSIGTSVEGRNVWAIKISDNPAIDEDEPEVLFTGLHHAREPISMEIVLETINRLTDGYGVDSRITEIVDHCEIWFIPCVNPDGYVFNTTHAPNGGGMWRKNRRDNNDGSFGVDLNRNYGYEWGYDNTGSSQFPFSETYRGPSPFSEPETQAIRAFLNSRDLVFMVNYHSYGDLYLWPWGYDRLYTSDEQLFRTIGDSLATFNSYGPAVGWALYLTNGDANDWAYGATTEHNSVLAFTPEVGSSQQGFWPPEDDIPALIEENIEPNLLFLELAGYPERIFPPAIPIWTTPDTATSADVELTWSDPGGANPAVLFKLIELEDPYRRVDDAESAVVTDWIFDGFSLSTTRAASGAHSYYSGAANASRMRMTASEYLLVEPHDSLTFQAWYNIEFGYDYAYVELSTDGGESFVTVPGNITTSANPNGFNRGHGITGSSNGFVTAGFDLSAYAGQYVLIRISYETDAGFLNEGLYVDDIGPVQSYSSTSTLVDGAPGSSFMVTGKPEGVYLYRTSAIDSDGQTSPLGPPNAVMVVFPIHGDLDHNGVIDAVDLNLLIEYMFFNGPPARISGAEECDGIADVNINDVLYLIDYIFRNGPVPIGAPMPDTE
ncbi:MAG: hypothetical protein GF341_09415 [candidate division Zixibacteria bacterium]|nr:hypothetical protein [candidate division Zixibacteria bacterium]